MKILQVGAKNYPPAHGGTERLVADLVEGLSDTENHIFVEWEPDCPVPRVQRLPGNILMQWIAVRRYIKNNKIDIVHLHKTNYVPLGLMLKLSGVKCILTVHGCGWRRGEKRWGPVVKLTAACLDFLACLFLDRVVLVGEHDWLSFKKFMPSWRLKLIRNGVSVDYRPSNGDRKGWVYLGRVSPEKNILKLIEAAEVLPEKLAIYGPVSPPNLRFEKAFLKKLEGSNAEWKGPLPSKQVRKVLSQYKVFINPSSTEGLPFTVLEAAAEGLHLVLSDIRPHHLLGFPSCDYVNAENLDLRPFLRDTNGDGQANRMHVRNEYNIDIMRHSYRALYDEIVGSSKVLIYREISE